MIGIILLLFVITPLAIAAVFIVAGKRRMDQGTVLWAMAIAANSRLSMSEEIDAVADGLSKRQRKRANTLSDRLLSGDALDVALKKTPHVIPHAAMLDAIVGLQNGTLPEALRSAAVRHTSRARKSESGGVSPTMNVAYLTAVPLVFMLVVTYLMYWIVPKFKKIYDDFDTKLPEMSSQLFTFADFFVNHILLAALVVAASMFVAWFVINRYRRGWGESDVPLIGRWFRRLDVPGVLRNLSQTVAANRPIEDALWIVCKNHRRRSVRKSLSRVSEKCDRGDDCWYAMRDVGLLTRREVAVLRSAQRVGNLSWALGQLADAIERRLANRWQTFAEFAKPAVVALIGVSAAYVYIAFFYPLVSLLQAQ